jgi:3',5'-cyclic-AMP phosphodiesterase
MIVLAQISDLHLDGGVRAAIRAERVMTYLNDLPVPVDAVLVTGDIADHGLADEYQEARKVLSSPVPVLVGQWVDRLGRAWMRPHRRFAAR